MYKILCHNNLIAVGKWGGTSFVPGFMIAAFMFGGNLPSYAYESDKILLNQPTELKLDFNQIGKINEITAPVNNLINSAINGLRFDQNINIGTWIPISPVKNSPQNTDFSKFFSSSTVSQNDIMSFLKEASITGINLSILIISITSQVLKGILSVLK